MGTGIPLPIELQEFVSKVHSATLPSCAEGLPNQVLIIMYIAAYLAETSFDQPQPGQFAYLQDEPYPTY
jgi:hypothetical protein